MTIHALGSASVGLVTNLNFKPNRHKERADPKPDAAGVYRGQAKIRLRLISDFDPDEWQLPPKPKWMRWRAYAGTAMKLTTSASERLSVS